MTSSCFPAWRTPRPDAAVLRMRLGTQLRRLREAAGITPGQAGYEIRASRSKISRLEDGRVKLKSRDITDLLQPRRRGSPSRSPGRRDWQRDGDQSRHRPANRDER